MSASESDGFVRDFLSRDLRRPDEVREPPSVQQGVRSFVITQGRTTSASSKVKFETMLSVTPRGRAEATRLLFEHADIVGLLFRDALSVAEVAAMLSIPLGVAMVVCGDMVHLELLEAHGAPDDLSDDVPLILRLIQGVRVL